MKKNSFENSLRLTKMSLLSSGVLIESSKKFTASLATFVFYFNLLWLYTDVFGEFYWLFKGIQIGKSFSELSQIAPCATVCLLATAKTAPLFLNRSIAVSVVNMLRKMHSEIEQADNFGNDVEIFNENDTFSVKNNDSGIIQDDDKENDNFKSVDGNKSKKIEDKIVEDSMRFLTFVILLLFYTSIVVVTVFCLSPLMVMGYDYFMQGETELLLPFLIKYFFDPFTTTMWPWVYLHQVWSTIVAAANVFGGDTYIYIFCSYTEMQFHILSHRYEQVTGRKSLVDLVKRHQELIHLVDQVEIMFSNSTLFNIVSSSVLICLSTFNITFLDDIGAQVSFLTFLVMSLSQISLLCFFGDMLLRASLEVSDAIYKSRWYDADKATKRSVFIILLRAQKPCKLTANGFADLNLTAFTTILSRSWSLFALLKTVYD